MRKAFLDDVLIPNRPKTEEIEERRMPNIWCDLGDDEIYRLTKLAYISFYFRPRLLAKHIASIKSTHEFQRYSTAFLKMFFEKFGKRHWSLGPDAQLISQDI